MTTIEDVIKRVSGPEWQYDGDSTWSWRPNGPDEYPRAILTVHLPRATLTVHLFGDEPFFGLYVWHTGFQYFHASTMNPDAVVGLLNLVGPRQTLHCFDTPTAPAGEAELQEEP